MKRTPFVHIVILIAFVLNLLGSTPVLAQPALPVGSEFILPQPGVMVRLSPPENPAVLKGIKVNPNNPFRFDFILDKGDSENTKESLQQESTKLIKYFLASLTIPEKDLWVNLSPYEKDRIIPQSFGVTEMGRDLLAEDYILKQITASLIYPEDEVGKKFWKKIYEEASKKYGTTNIPVNTFNKVWIVPAKAVVYENAAAGTAYVVESKLKVMLEVDYLSSAKNVVGAGLAPAQDKRATASVARTDSNELGSQIVREIVIPELTKEVNEGKNFEQLRQVYNSLILANWYKKKIKDSILSQVYTDKNKVTGINVDNPEEKQKIYQQYLQAFKKGVYNFIKEDLDPVTQERIPRKYFSGGMEMSDKAMKVAISISSDAALIAKIPSKTLAVISASMTITSPKTVGKQDQAMLIDVDPTEAARVLNRVEIHGQLIMEEKLTREELQRLGMTPKYKVKVGGRDIYFSTPYKIGTSRIAILGYVQDGSMYVARTYYISGSQGLWRYLPRVRFNEENKIVWFDKGFSEDSLPLPYQIQKALLSEMMDKETPLELSVDDQNLLFAGTTNQEGRTYRGAIAPLPQRMTFKDDPGAIGGYVAPENLAFSNLDDRPNFDQLIESYTFNSPIYGRLMVRIFPSMSSSNNSPKYKFTFMEDGKGRCWIANIETNGYLSTLGLSTSWVKGGSFTVPVYEYEQQSYGYGNSEDAVYRPGTNRILYVDMWKNYLSKVPIIKEFHQRFVLQEAKTLTPTGQIIEELTLPKIQSLAFRQSVNLSRSDRRTINLKVGRTLVQVNQDEKGYFGVRVGIKTGKELSRRVYFQDSLNLGREGKTNRFKMNDVLSTVWLDPDVSREHVRITIEKDQVTIEDQGSTHGTRYLVGKLTPEVLIDFAMTSQPAAQERSRFSEEDVDKVYKEITDAYEGKRGQDRKGNCTGQTVVLRIKKLIDERFQNDPKGRTYFSIVEDLNIPILARGSKPGAVTVGGEKIGEIVEEGGRFVQHSTITPEIVRLILNRVEKKVANLEYLKQTVEEGHLNTALKEKGGIDFNSDKINLQIQNSGEGIKFKVDPAILQQLRNASGFTPVIMNIQPLESLPLFLGIKDVLPVVSSV